MGFSGGLALRGRGRLVVKEGRDRQAAVSERLSCSVYSILNAIIQFLE